MIFQDSKSALTAEVFFVATAVGFLTWNLYSKTSHVDNSKVVEPKASKTAGLPTSLSAESIAVVKATAPVVAEHALEITTLFYKTMFKNKPEVMHYFNKAHQVGQAQPKALADSVIAYATHIEELDKLGPLIQKIAERHVALAILPEHYLIVHENLMKAIAEVLGDAVTPEIAAGWSEAVLFLAYVCISAEEKLYQEKEAKKGGWRYEKEFVVHSKKQIANDTVQFQFKLPEGNADTFDFVAGQYLTIRVPALGDRVAPRHYTLTSQPGSSVLEITQRLVQGGVMSTYMHKSLKVGDKVLLGAPSGVFVPMSKTNDMVLISAGIGVTPMVAFYQSCKPRVTAICHVDQSNERHACSEVFNDCPNKIVHYSKSEGRANIKELASKLVNTSGTKSDYYICGPNGFMEKMEDALREVGCINVYAEVFGTGNVKTNSVSKCPFHF